MLTHVVWLITCASQSDGRPSQRDYRLHYRALSITVNTQEVSVDADTDAHCVICRRAGEDQRRAATADRAAGAYTGDVQ